MENITTTQANWAEVAASPSVQQPSVAHVHLLKTHGRLGRLSYLAWSFVMGMIAYLIVYPLMLVGMLSTGLMLGRAPDHISGAAQVLFSLLGIVFLGVFLFVVVVNAAKRLHDLDMSAHWLWMLAVPVLGWLAFMLFSLYLIFAPGTPGPNRFGPPRATPQMERMIGIIQIAMICLAIAVYVVMFAVLGVSGIFNSIKGFH